MLINGKEYEVKFYREFVYQGRENRNGDLESTPQTECQIFTDPEGAIGYGVTVKNPDDPIDDRDYGRRVAFKRALEHAEFDRQERTQAWAWYNRNYETLKQRIKRRALMRNLRSSIFSTYFQVPR